MGSGQSETRVHLLSVAAALARHLHSRTWMLPPICRLHLHAGQWPTAAFTVVVCVARARSLVYALLILPFVGSLARLRTAVFSRSLAHLPATSRAGSSISVPACSSIPCFTRSLAPPLVHLLFYSSSAYLLLPVSLLTHHYPCTYLPAARSIVRP